MVKSLILVQGTGSKSRSNAAYSVNKKQIKGIKKNTKNNQLVISTKQVPLNNSFTVKQKPRKVNGSVTGNLLTVSVSHAEYLSDIKTPTAYKGGFISYKIQINPGLKGVFPWCSKMASSFEAYSISNLKLCYKPSTSTVTKGVVFMAALYDVSSTAPEGKSDMLETQGCVETTPFTPLVFKATKGTGGMNNQKTYKLRNGSEQIEPINLKLYDCANIFFSYQGVSENGIFADLTIGELWIDYTLNFHIPVANTSKILIDNIESVSAYGNTGMSVSRFLGTNLVERLSGKLASAGLTLVENAAGYFWTTAKKIVKSIFISVIGTIGAPLVPLLALFDFIAGETIDDGDSGFNLDDEDQAEHTQLLIDGSSKMVLNTNTALDAYGNVNDTFLRLTNSEFNSVNKQRVCRYQLKMNPGQVLRMKGDGIEVPVRGQMTMTDFTLSKAVVTNTVLEIY